MSTNAVTLNAADTSLSAAEANILANSTAMVGRLNADLLKRYQNAYADYLLNMQAGGFVPEDHRKAPAPPMAWQLAAPDADGFVWYEVGTTPVADPAKYPDSFYAGGNPQPNHQPNMIMIGKRNGGPSSKWFSALPGDTFGNGATTPPDATSADGVVGTFEKFGGVASPGWYLLVS